MRDLPTHIPFLTCQPTEVGYFVLIDTSTPLRMCSWGDMEWDGHLWAGDMLKKLNVSQESKPWAQAAELEIVDPDGAVLNILLESQTAGVRARVWYAMSHTLDVPPVLMMEMFVDAVKDSVGASAGVTTITLMPDDGESLRAPRERITTADYEPLIAPGAVIKFNGGQISLVRGG